MKIICALTLLSCCVCHAADSEPTILSPAGSERFLRVVDGGAFSTYFYFTISDDRFLFEQFDPPKNNPGPSILATRKDVKLTAQEATEVWKKIGVLRIDQWRKRYEPQDLGVEAFDGTSWLTYLRYEGRESHSSGFNVFPAIAPLGSPVLEVNERGELVKSAYHQLLKLLHELAKG